MDPEPGIDRAVPHRKCVPYIDRGLIPHSYMNRRDGTARRIPATILDIRIEILLAVLQAMRSDSLQDSMHWKWACSNHLP